MKSNPPTPLLPPMRSPSESVHWMIVKDFFRRSPQFTIFDDLKYCSLGTLKKPRRVGIVCKEYTAWFASGRKDTTYRGDSPFTRQEKVLSLLQVKSYNCARKGI